MFFLVAVAVAEVIPVPLDGCCSSVEATFTELTEFSGTYTKEMINGEYGNYDAYIHEREKVEFASNLIRESYSMSGGIENVTLGQTSFLSFLNPDGPSDTFENKCVSEIGEVIVERGIRGYEFVRDDINVTCLSGTCGNGCESVNFEAAGELDFLSGNYTKLCSGFSYYCKDDEQGCFVWNGGGYFRYSLVTKKECDSGGQPTYPEEMVSYLSIVDSGSGFILDPGIGTANECIANNTFVGALRNRYRAGTAKFVCKGEVEEEEDDTEPWIIAVAVITPVVLIAVGCYIKGRGKKAQLEALL